MKGKQIRYERASIIKKLNECKDWRLLFDFFFLMLFVFIKFNASFWLIGHMLIWKLYVRLGDSI